MDHPKTPPPPSLASNITYFQKFLPSSATNQTRDRTTAAVSSNAYSTGAGDQPPPTSKLTLDVSGNSTEPGPLTSQGTGHFELRNHSGSSQADLPRDPGSSSNVHEPPPPPPHLSTSYLARFLPALSSSSGPPPPPPIPSPPPHSGSSVPDYGPHRLTTRYLQKLAPFSPMSSDPARDRTKDDYNQLLVGHQRTRDDLKQLEGEYQRLAHANREIEQDRTRYREHACALQKELKDVQQELEEYSDLSEMRGEELRDARRELDDARALSEIRRKELMKVKREREDYRNLSENQGKELTNLKREFKDYRDLSEIRGKELMDAQALLSKPDTLSVAELRQKVSDLNDATYAAAAWFGGAFIHTRPLRTSKGQTQATYKAGCMVIGEPAANILVAHSGKPEIDPVVVRLVMQIYLAKFCSAKIERWYEGRQETNDSLRTIYEEIRHNEEKTISGTWKALTHTYTRPSTDNWANDFGFRLQYIMKVASWEVSTPEMKSAFEQNLKPVFKAILDVRIALGEHFTSADFEVFCPPAGALFDPQQMEDALFDRQREKKNGGDGSDAGGGGGNLVGTIIGTAGLGLREVPRRGTPGGSLVVLLPKVVL